VLLLDATDRRLLKLAWPAFLTLSAEPIYILVDNAIVGHISTTALGGLAIAGTILSTISWLIAFLASGVTTQVAQRKGAGDDEGARRAVSQGLNLALLLGFASALIIVIGAPQLAALVGGKKLVLEAAITYLRVSALGLPAVAVTFAALGWFRGIEDLRLPVRVVIGANIANVLLEMLFVWVFKWGIGGSAWATVLVQWSAVAVYLGSMRKVIKPQRPQREALRALGRIGGAMLVRTGLMVSTITASTWLASRLGDTSLGAHQIGFQIYFFFALMVDALAVSSQSVFASQIGSGEQGELWSVTRRLMRLGLLAGLFLASVLALGSTVLGRFFSSDPAVLKLSVGVLLWCALMQITGAVVFVLDGVLMGADLFAKLAFGAMASAVAFWILAALQIRNPPLFGGLNGVWIALNVWMGVRLVGNVSIAVRYLRNLTGKASTDRARG
jgi:putative MATE family efflux protein